MIIQAQTSSSPLLILGQTTFRKNYQRFGLLQEDRLRHLWLLGKTGSGKSTLIANLVAQDLHAGTGLALLDPHGDLVDKVLPLIPPSRINQVLLFNPNDRQHPVSFNIFRQGRQLHPDMALLASQLISVFRKFWADSWGPRLEHILRNAILAVSTNSRANLLFLYRFLTDDQVRDKVVASLTDPVVSQFWKKEFPNYPKNLQGEALSPVLNKLGAFVAHPVVRNIVGQERSRINLINLMSGKGILLANLATGRIGEDVSHLLGGLLLTAIQLAAMERPRGGPPFIVYVDEFQYFVNESLSTMLSESRKFGLGLVLAHQYLAQLPLSIRDAVLGNVGSSVIFRLGGQDAAILEPEFSPPFTAYDLQSLEQYHAVVKVLVQGKSLRPFSARTLAEPPTTPDSRDKVTRIKEQSRQRYCQPRDQVEKIITSAV